MLVSSYRNCPRSLSSHFCFDFFAGAASMCILRLRQLRDIATEGVGGDQFSLSSVPLRKNLCGGRASENAWVNEAREPHVRDMSRGTKNSLKVPDRFCTAEQLSEQLELIN